MMALPAALFAGNCHITLRLQDCKADSVNAMIVDFNNPEEIAKQQLAIVNGQTSMDLPADGVRLIIFTFLNSDKATMPAMVRTYAIPDCLLDITCTTKGFTTSGSPEYESINRARQAVGEYNIALRDTTFQPRALAYIKANPKEVGSAFIACDLDEKGLEEADKMLSSEAKDRLKGYYDYFLNKRLTAPRTMEENAKKSGEGNPAPDFTLTTIDGKQFSLSSYRGRYVVLDFWGSWCQPCIKSMPKMREYYDKYHARGLEVVSVACNDTDAKWRAAVNANGMIWTNVINTKNSLSDENILVKYGIYAFPTMLFISPDGIIQKKSIGESPEFFAEIDKTFK